MLQIAAALQESWWPVSESNQGHADFQSAALPTELTGLSAVMHNYVKEQALGRSHPHPSCNANARKTSDRIFQGLASRASISEQPDFVKPGPPLGRFGKRLRRI
jgi:hypothetical protein